ncbi:uncharacterized protein LOC130640925 isoform X1 [Hydractinia symbiolongicarpus]|uniref:uncharacterized protein LOC130640925 isoform X1 n=1 Tax=Hydractinia symbiolongicarpus TaxID=13093 RepID=UPI00254D3E4A|nr:uncharacterized protein LOC130640925 isoform X1 [Hydractinia symbiolongicarpus]
MDKDPGRLKYRIHNLYLNFLETYGRTSPEKLITLHQKALFTFWMSTVVLWVTVKLWKVCSNAYKNYKKKEEAEDIEKNTDEEQINQEDLFAPKEENNYTPLQPGHVSENPDGPVQVHYSPVKTNKSPSKSNISPAKSNPIESIFSPFKNSSFSPSKNCSPSKRKDYLDESAFQKEPEESLTDVTVKATIFEMKKIEATIQDNIPKLSEAKLDEFKEDEKENLDNTSEKDPKKRISWTNIKLAVSDVFQAHDKDQPTFEKFLFKMMIFGCFMFYFWLTDYLHIWPKVAKQYSRDMFVFLFFLLVFVAVVFSIRKAKDKLLHRDQTEEWKGWMQVQFVWYHYFDAQETFNSIRCYVGAYVWMTGFGNYIYFSTRKDYSIYRLLKMLFRLNFLVFCIMAVTNHVFVRYYICAMHTYWFLSVWAVMVAFNRYNDNPKFVLLKFGIYFAINAMIFNIPGASEKVFTPFKWVLHDDNGTLHYWKYRAWLDHWSTLVGMFFAFNFQRLENFLKYLDEDDPKTKQKRESIRYFITAILLAIFAVWFYFILRKEKNPYLALHPFTSPVPIVIYAILRNIHPVLRTYYLNLFTWLGKITLETYLSQIHIYMMGNAKMILVYLPQYPMLNFALSTLIYIGVSYVLFHLTVFFSSYIFPRNGKVVIKNIILGGLWLGACYMFSYILTQEHVWNSKKSGLEFLIWKVKKY